MKAVVISVALFVVLNAANGVPLEGPISIPFISSKSLYQVSPELDPFRNFPALPCTANDTAPIGLRNGLIDPRWRWKDFIVTPDRVYNQQERDAIYNAMFNLKQVIPCVNFVLYPNGVSPPDPDYIYIFSGTGCGSLVGRQGGRQTISLQTPGCMSVGTIMHEMIHALGLTHEQNRPDRDDYVNIHWENICPGAEWQFTKRPSDSWSAFGVRYNYRSIMHYGGNDFSSNGRPTITAKTGEQVGSVGILQSTDIQKLRNMYNCGK